MNTQTQETKNPEQEKMMSTAMKNNLKEALKRFEVKKDWCDSVGKNIFYVCVKSKDSEECFTFNKSYFMANEKKVVDKLNLIGTANGHIHDALVAHISDLIDKKEFTEGSPSKSTTQSFEQDDQVSMAHARSVARNFLLNKSRFAFQSDKNYDSSKHLGLILDQESNLPEGVIAVGFKGGALQAVLNPRGHIQSQKYRREILGGLVHIGVLDAKIDEYDQEFDMDEEAEVTVKVDGFTTTAKAQDLKNLGFKVDSTKKKESRLDKQRDGVKVYIMHFSEELLKEMKKYVAA